MLRLRRAGLAVLLIVSLGSVAEALAQGAPPTVDERRGIQMKADILSLKTMLALRDDQSAKWDAYEKALQTGIEQTRSFGVDYCTLGGSVIDHATGPAALAKRTSDLEILFRQRAKELASLATQEKDFASSLSQEQSNTYAVLSGRVMGMAMLPAYAHPSNGMPSVCPPSGMALSRGGR